MSSPVPYHECELGDSLNVSRLTSHHDYDFGHEKVAQAQSHQFCHWIWSPWSGLCRWTVCDQ